ncbi:four helix bundle protein [soil metagenome]
MVYGFGMDWSELETTVVSESRADYGITESAYRKLRIWQSGFQLTIHVYRITREFPRDELYGLTSQMRRAAVSIPSNIAEGSSRRSTADFLRFLTISAGSINELDTQVEIASALGYLQNAEDLRRECNHLARMLARFMQKLDSNPDSDP